MESPGALADEMRRRRQPRLVRDTAARQEADSVVPEEPRRGFGSVSRVRILREEHDETATEPLVQRREQRRQGGLGNTRASRQSVDERGDALVLDEFPNDGVKYRTVHDEWRNRRFRWVDRTAGRLRNLQDVRGVERFGPLKERQFRLLWLGRTGSAVGDSLIPVALIFSVYAINGDVTDVGIVFACYFAAGAGVTLAGGVWADRLSRRAVMITADLIRIGTQAATAALLFDGTMHVWELAVLQGIAGACGGFFNPASTALVPQTVSPELLQRANALLALSRSVTMVFGPAISGVIIAAAEPGWAFAIDAGSFLVSVLFVAAMRVDAQARPAVSHFWSELRDGWHEVRRHRWLTAGFLGYAFGNLGVGMYIVLGSVVAKDDLGGARPWGFIVGAAAVGMVCGGLVSYRVKPQRPVAAAFAIWALMGLPAFSLVKPFPLSVVMAAAVVFGFAVIIGNVLWETAMQREVQPERLARVASFDVLLSLGLLPIGYVIAGPLSVALSVPAALLLAGACMCIPNLAVVLFVRDVRAVRETTTPLRPQAAARTE
jgi:MFS family permease